MAASPVLPNDPAFLPDVYRGICQVAKAISKDGIAKGGRNQQQGYSFRGIDDVMNALSALLAGADICILPRMLSRVQTERTTAKGGVLFYVTVQADFDFVSARDGSRHTVTMYGEAMDSADKATNKAMSAAYKCACLQVFCIPTEGMADADAITHAPAPKPPAKEHHQAQPLQMPKPPQPAATMHAPEAHEEEPYYEEIPLPEEERSEIEQQLRDSVAIVEARRSLRLAFEAVQAQYAAINGTQTYLGILAMYGVRDAGSFEDLTEARAAYRQMRVDLAKRETRGK